MTYENHRGVKALAGKTLAKVYQVGDEKIVFVTSEGDTFEMYHYQDCCEYVYIESVEGDLQSLVGNPLLVAEEVSGETRGPQNDYDESYTWTFYKFATIRGHVDIRWYGSSNGYYSEAVSFEQVKP